MPSDRTRLELWTLAGPPDEYAFMVPFVLTGFTIPAGDPAYTLVEEGGYGGPDATLVAVTPHAHLRATAASMSLTRADGTEVCLADVPNFDFHDQALHWYTPEDRVVVAPADTLRISCTWDNSAANQPVVDGVALPVTELHEGPGTFDEMCQQGWLVLRPYGG